MTDLMKAAALVSDLNKQIEAAQAELKEARETVAKLEIHLPVLEDDLSEAEASLALAAKSFKGGDLTKGEVADFSFEAKSPGADRAASIPSAESVSDLGAGATEAGDTADGGSGAVAQGEASTTEDEADPVEDDPDPFGTADRQIERDAADFSRPAPAPASDTDPERGVMMEQASKELHAADGMLNELDAEDGEGPAF